MIVISNAHAELVRQVLFIVGLVEATVLPFDRALETLHGGSINGAAPAGAAGVARQAVLLY